MSLAARPFPRPTPSDRKEDRQMYIKDGIAYAGEASPELEIASARYVGNLQMVVTFTSGEERLFDATKFSDMPVLAPLMDERMLEDFSIDHGVLTWRDGEIDIAPEAVYDRSFEYRGKS